MTADVMTAELSRKMQANEETSEEQLWYYELWKARIKAEGPQKIVIAEAS